jgi:hypothetical protein
MNIQLKSILMLTISKIVYNIKNTRKINGNSPRWTSAASERAQRAKRAERSGTLGKLCDPKPFQEASLKQTGGNHKNKRRFPFHVESGLCWGWFWEPRRLQKSEKTIGFIRFSAIFRDLC